MADIDNPSFAEELDKNDPLKHYRNAFFIPETSGESKIYFTGNSLGLQPKNTERFIKEELGQWAKSAVAGHFNDHARPWFHYHKFSKQALANIVGATPGEVVSMNSLTTNLHLLMVSFYRPATDRYKIIIEKGAFPSDQYAVESQIKYHGFDCEDALVEIAPRPDEHILRAGDIINTIEQHGDKTALVMLGGVQYYTGQFFNLREIANAAHKVGAFCGFDLAHAAGNVMLNLHGDNVDFATWCSYKYLNSGPGGISGIFVHEKHGHDKNIPRFAGWWGHKEAKRFKMQKGFDPMPGADGWQLSNANVLSGAAHLASLQIFEEAGMPALRQKSKKLTGYCYDLINLLNKEKERVQIITPKNPDERGCQLSLIMKEKGKQVFEALTKTGVVADWREPDVIRIAPVPLYNTFMEVHTFYDTLKKVLNAK